MRSRKPAMYDHRGQLGVVTTGSAAVGVEAISNNGGDVKVTTTGVSTAGTGSQGIYAYAGGAGKSVVVSGGNVSTTGFNSTSALYARANGSDVTVGFRLRHAPPTCSPRASMPSRGDRQCLGDR